MGFRFKKPRLGIRKSVSIVPGVSFTFSGGLRSNKAATPGLKHAGRFVLWLSAITILVIWLVMR